MGLMKNSVAFIQSEINRIDKTLIGFKRTVFKNHTSHNYCLLYCNNYA